VREFFLRKGEGRQIAKALKSLHWKHRSYSPRLNNAGKEKKVQPKEKRTDAKRETRKLSAKKWKKRDPHLPSLREIFSKALSRRSKHLLHRNELFITFGEK